MFIKNAWYAGAWAHELNGVDMLPRKLLGQRIIFFRTSMGRATALRDRCSHRFAPLSIGRREGDCIRCMYHGLVFDADGHCVEEPGRKGVSPNTAVQAYPVVERYRLLWIWMGDPERADPGLIPDCHFQDDPEWASIPAYIHYKADYRLILDNLLDFSHLTYVHETTLGGSDEIARIRPVVEKTGHGVRMTRWYLNEPEVAPYLRGVSRFEGPVDRWHIYDLTTAGNVFNMDSGSAPAGTGAPDGHRVAQAMQFHATQIVTPEDERNSHFFWSYAHNFDVGNAALTQMLASRILEGFEEDKAMIEAQQHIIDESGDDPMAFILADNGLALGRRLIETTLAEEASVLAIRGG
ncbi:MAG: aromatic ring-hydroxylating dioxygenase subunit alpha [Novosphingobium sp.]